MCFAQYAATSQRPYDSSSIIECRLDSQVGSGVMIQQMSASSQAALRRKRSKIVEVLIETPRGSRNKFTYDEKRNAFRLKTVLPIGASFPYDFGFVPGTQGEDGDP